MNRFCIGSLLLGLLLPLQLFSQLFNFSGISWTVRSGFGGPGPNYWSDLPALVETDSAGNLNLRIQPIGNTWHCAEIAAERSFGYGEYSFELLSNAAILDPWTVAGFFLYESDTREVDIEFSRWGVEGELPAWFTIQPPPYTPANQLGFMIPPFSGITRHSFFWSSDSTVFKSVIAQNDSTHPGDSILCQWTSHQPANIIPGNERLHINFWLFQGHEPVTPAIQELIIRKVSVPGVQSEQQNVPLISKSRLYPNPSRDCIFLEFRCPDGGKNILLIDPLGTGLKRMNTGQPNLRVDLNGLSKGLYSVIIADLFGTEVLRFIKL